MAKRGGKRPGAGRPKGAASRRTREVADAAAKLGLSPLEYLLKAMSHPQTTQRRKDRLAEVCLPYLHPRLNAVASVDASPANSCPPLEIKILAVPRGCQVDKNGVIHHPDGTPASAAETKFTPFTPTPDLLPVLPAPEPTPAEPLPVLVDEGDDKVAILHPHRRRQDDEPGSGAA
jgi:hypothetical protein